MNSTEKKLIKAVESYADSMRMLDCTDMIVAYSGGADSSLLLYLMKKTADARGIRLIAAHVNHMIRGSAADSDEEFCRRECERYGVEFRCEKIDIPALSKARKIGCEECARDERYAFFDRIKADVEEKRGGRCHIAVAHNATDNAETMLFNLARGASPDGMCGIPPIRNGYVVRPLLTLTKERISELCAELGVSYVTDATNAETVYTRNRIRHKILPQMREINPSFEAACRRSGTLLRRDSEYLCGIAKDAYGQMGEHPDCAALSQLHSSVASRVLCMYFDDMGAGYEYTHIEKCLELISGGGDFSLSLIGKKRVRAYGGKLTVENDSRQKPTPAAPWSVRLGMGENTLPDGSKIFLLESPETANDIKTQNVYKLFIQQTLTGDTISNVFIARSRKEGDCILCSGHTHKIKKLLSEKKIPPHMRDTIPIVERDGRIVWVASVRAADGEGKEPPIYLVYAKK